MLLSVAWECYIQLSARECLVAFVCLPGWPLVLWCQLIRHTAPRQSVKRQLESGRLRLWFDSDCRFSVLVCSVIVAKPEDDLVLILGVIRPCPSPVIFVVATSNAPNYPWFSKQTGQNISIRGQSVPEVEKWSTTRLSFPVTIHPLFYSSNGRLTRLDLISFQPTTIRTRAPTTWRGGTQIWSMGACF